MNASGKAAIVIGAVAAGAFVWFYVADSGDRGPGEAITCGLTTAAAGAAVVALTRGESAGQIAGTALSGVFVPIACKDALETLEDERDSPVTLDLTLPSGGVDSKTITGTDVFQTPPDPNSAPTSDIPPGTTISEMIACSQRWTSHAAWIWCLEGLLPP